MKLFEDYIRRYFREATSTEEVDVDDLWADIEAGLPPENEEEPVGGSPFRGVVLSLLLGGLVVAGLLLWPFGDQQERVLTESGEEESISTGREFSLPAEAITLEAGSSEDEPVTTEMELVKDGPKPSTSAASFGKRPPAPAGPAKKTAPLSIEAKATTNAPAGATTGRTKEQRKKMADRTTVTPSRTAERIAAETSRLPTDDLLNNPLNPSSEERKATSSLSGTTPPGPEKEAEASSVLSALALLPSLTIDEPLSIDEKPLALPPVTFYPPSPETFRKTGTAKLEFRVSAGSSQMFRKYLAPSEGYVANALNAAVGNTFGQSVSLELSYRLSSKFRLNTGLEYWRTHNTFRYTIERDTVTAHPSFPYRTTAARSIRRIAHNNYQQFLSLPVLLEYRRTFGRYAAGLGAGIGLNYQLGASGRTLASADEVVSYNSSSGDTPDFFLSYRLRPSLMYSPKPNSRTKLLLQANVQYYRFGESSVTGLRQRAILLGGSVGLTFRL